MSIRLARKSLAIIIGTFGGLFAAGDLLAQDPTPRPIAPPAVRPMPAPLPPAKQPPPQPAPIRPEALRTADLRLTLRPTSLTAVPNTLNVENAGPAAAGSSLLRVTVRTLPPDLSAGPIEWAARFEALGIDLRGSDFGDLCEPPFEDFEARINPLGAGESEEVSRRPESWAGGGIREVGLVATTPAIRVPTHSYFQDLGVRLVCVYELRATVDANREVAESNERNNEVVHIFQREVTLR